MNPKIARVASEIEKTKAKIAGATARLRELEKQKNELENAELVAVIRGMKATPEEFEAFLAAKRGVPQPEPAGNALTEDEGDNHVETQSIGTLRAHVYHGRFFIFHRCISRVGSGYGAAGFNGGCQRRHAGYKR